MKNNMTKVPKLRTSLVILILGLVLMLTVIIHLLVSQAQIFNSGFSSLVVKEEPITTTTITKDKSIQEIIIPNDGGIPVPKGYPSNLTCGAINTARYAHLHNQTLPNEPPIQFYFALDLDDAVHVMHTLFLAISKAMIHLGPQRCFLSIVGNPSKDGTWAYLEALETYMKRIGVRTFLKKSMINSRESQTSRIEKLAKLRNEALEPLFQLNERKEANSSTVIIFSNDISLCPNDVLELVHQHLYQKADAVCALDWNRAQIFYDAWIARTYTGHMFLNVEKKNWTRDGRLFFNDPIAKRYLDRKKPFQVFSCWNGILTLSSEPFLKSNIRFRAPFKDECQGGEPFHMATDFWNNGYYKIAVAPTVNVAYTDGFTKHARGLYGNADNLKLNLKPIVWNPKPPPKVSCPKIHEGWRLEYIPWNDTVSIINREMHNQTQKI